MMTLAVFLLLAPAAQERGKQIVQEALAALGGDKFLAMEDRVESGRAYSFFREELSGLARAKIYTRYLNHPAALRVRERQAFGKDENQVVLLTEKEGYEITFRGARPMPDTALDRFRDSTRRNIFYMLRMRLKEPGLILESRGADIVSNEPVEVVEITDADNLTVTVYFHKSTKLPTRQVFHRRDPQTKEKIEEVTVFSKYRDVGGGVMWPFTIRRERNGEKIYEIFSESVAINQGLNDSLFMLPANMKILKKQK